MSNTTIHKSMNIIILDGKQNPERRHTHMGCANSSKSLHLAQQ